MRAFMQLYASLVRHTLSRCGTNITGQLSIRVLKLRDNLGTQ